MKRFSRNYIVSKRRKPEKISIYNNDTCIYKEVQNVLYLIVFIHANVDDWILLQVHG